MDINVCPSAALPSPATTLDEFTSAARAASCSVRVTGFGRARSATLHMYRDCKSVNNARYLYERNAYLSASSWARGSGLCKLCLKRAYSDHHPITTWAVAWEALLRGREFISATSTADVTSRRVTVAITDADKAACAEAVTAAKESLPTLSVLWTEIESAMAEAESRDDVATMLHLGRVRSKAVSLWGTYRRVCGVPGGSGLVGKHLLTVIEDRRHFDVEAATYTTVGRQLVQEHPNVLAVDEAELKRMALKHIRDVIDVNHINVGCMPMEFRSVRRADETSTEWLVREWNEAVEAHVEYLAAHWAALLAQAGQEDEVWCHATIDVDSALHNMDGGETLRVWDKTTTGKKVTYTVPVAVAGYILSLARSGVSVTGVGEHATLVSVAMELYRPGEALNGDLDAAVRTAALATAA